MAGTCASSFTRHQRHITTFVIFYQQKKSFVSIFHIVGTFYCLGMDIDLMKSGGDFLEFFGIF